jgi:hypothetical protein
MSAIWVTQTIERSFWGWDFAEGKVTIRGSGDSPATFVHRADVARYVGYVFTHIPPSELAWRVLRIEAEQTVSPRRRLPGSNCLLTHEPIDVQQHRRWL